MKNPFAWFGAVVIVMALLGSLSPFDFKLCFGPKGYCNKAAPTPGEA